MEPTINKIEELLDELRLIGERIEMLNLLCEDQVHGCGDKTFTLMMLRWKKREVEIFKELEEIEAAL